jgi:ATP-dependent exoDNAse (exonuclease V) beta subunit
MASAERWLTEIPYTLPAEDGQGRFKQGIIDALFLKDGIWTVVEYKTDRLGSQQALAETLEKEDYLGQLERYSQAVEQLLDSRPRALLVFLDVENRIHILERNSNDLGEP